MNLTLHPYFNLRNLPQETVEKYLLEIRAKKYLPLKGGMIPTGEQREVLNSPFDFLSPRPIGVRIDNNDHQLKIAGEYDHCFVVDKTDQEETDMATLYDPESGRILTLRSNAPGLQLYTANFLCGEVIGKNNIPFRSRQSVCLGPQQFPNAPNEPSFPSTILEPGRLYHHRIVYSFDVDD